jgi:hypothetical protein
VEVVRLDGILVELVELENRSGLLLLRLGDVHRRSQVRMAGERFTISLKFFVLM